MRRTHALALLACIPVCAAALSTAASANSGSSSARASRAMSVDLRHTGLGSILTTASGQTLYLFTRDHGAHNSCVSVSGCSAAWPALETSGTPAAGTGVKASLLSTIRLPGGARQVTYAGHPLYLYSAESAHGSTEYVGVRSFGGAWDAVNAAGGAVK